MRSTRCQASDFWLNFVPKLLRTYKELPEVYKLACLYALSNFPFTYNIMAGLDSRSKSYFCFLEIPVEQTLFFANFNHSIIRKCVVEAVALRKQAVNVCVVRYLNTLCV